MINNTSVDFNDLSVINNPMLWSLCGVLPPDSCTREFFAFPSQGGGMSVLPHLSVVATVVVMAVAITGFV